MNESFAYVNRRGRRYFLGRGTTKRGKERFFFSRRPPANPVNRIPEGCEITESVNGIVSLRRSGRQSIFEEETSVVRSELARHAHLRRHRAAARGDAIAIYEPLGAQSEASLESISGRRTALLGSGGSFLDAVAADARYCAVMRFVLLDCASREFEAQRMCYRGGMEGWITIGGGLLPALARKFVRHNATEDFFEILPS